MKKILFVLICVCASFANAASMTKVIVGATVGGVAAGATNAVVNHVLNPNQPQTLPAANNPAQSGLYSTNPFVICSLTANGECISGYSWGENETGGVPAVYLRTKVGPTAAICGMQYVKAQGGEFYDKVLIFYTTTGKCR